MKIDVISDFHIEHNTLYMNTAYFSEADGDPYAYAWHKDREYKVLVMAGDTSNEANLTGSVIVEAAAYYDHVIFVDGNHENYDCTKFNGKGKHGEELWKVTRNVDDIMDQFGRFADDRPNITYLDGERHVIIDGCLFVGANGWYDFAVPTELSYRKRLLSWRQQTNDDVRIAFRGHTDDPKATANLARHQAKLIRKEVAWAQDQDDINEIVIVTHTVPDIKGVISVNDANHRNWYEANGGFHNSEMPRVLAADSKKKITTWIFGHTHRPQDFRTKHVRFICNPRGYRSNRQFNGLLHLDTQERIQSAFGKVE